MTQPEGLNSVTDPANDPEFHFAEDDGGGFTPDEARAFLARVIAPVGPSDTTEGGGNA